jgi:hypothetical protein
MAAVEIEGHGSWHTCLRAYFEKGRILLEEIPAHFVCVVYANFLATRVHVFPGVLAIQWSITYFCLNETRRTRRDVQFEEF